MKKLNSMLWFSYKQTPLWRKRRSRCIFKLNKLNVGELPCGSFTQSENKYNHIWRRLLTSSWDVLLLEDVQTEQEKTKRIKNWRPGRRKHDRNQRQAAVFPVFFIHRLYVCVNSNQSSIRPVCSVGGKKTDPGTDLGSNSKQRKTQKLTPETAAVQTINQKGEQLCDSVSK